MLKTPPPRVPRARAFACFPARAALTPTPPTSPDALIGAAKAAAAALSADGRIAVVPFRPADYAVAPRIPYATVDNAARIAKMRDAHLAAKSYSDEISQVVVSLLDVDKCMFVCNTEGVWASDRRPRMRLAVQAVASKDGDSQTGMDAPETPAGLRALSASIPPPAAARRPARP